MRKILIMLLILALSLPIVTAGYCALDFNNWGETDTYGLLKRQLPYDLIYNGIGRNGVSTVVTGCTSITPSYGVYSVYISSRTLTIGNGVAGQRVYIVGALNDTGTLTITATTKTGWTSVAMDAYRDMLIIDYVDDTIGWVIAGQYSITVS